MFLDALDSLDHKYELYKNQPNISTVHKGDTTKSTMHSIYTYGQPKCTGISNINKISCKPST